MPSTLEPPAYYLPKLERMRATNRYAKRWTLRLESKTNRHPECSGHPWGWYEIHPLNIEVGFWGSDKDDLKGVDINAWNEEAKRISHPEPSTPTFAGETNIETMPDGSTYRAGQSFRVF